MSTNKMKVKGVGRLKIKLHGNSVKLFDEVGYVPTFKRNLIFLGKLHFLGYRCFIHSRVMRVSQGVLMIIKGEKISVKNLYKLERSTLSGRLQLRQGAISTIKYARKYLREN